MRFVALSLASGSTSRTASSAIGSRNSQHPVSHRSSPRCPRPNVFPTRRTSAQQRLHSPHLAAQSHRTVSGPETAPEGPCNATTDCNSSVASNSSVGRDGNGASSSGAIHIRPAEMIDYWPAADLHCRVFNAAGDVGSEDDVFRGLSLRVDRIMALQINDKLAGEGGGNSVLLLAFEGEAPSTPEQIAAAKAQAQAAHVTRGSPLNASFPQPMWWLGRALAPGVGPGVGISAQSIGLVGVAAVDSFGDLVPPRELNWRTDGQMGWYRREGYAYVSNVAVAPAARRRGVARRLMAAAEALAAEWGCRAVGLHCNPRKREPWALYSSLGYRDSGVVEPAFMPYLQGRPPDRCSFLLKLVPAALRKKHLEQQLQQKVEG